MIRVLIRQVARANDIHNPTELAERVGVKHAVAWRWWNWAIGSDVPRMESFDKISQALGCEISDLYKQIPNGKAAKPSKNGDGKKRKARK